MQPPRSTVRLSLRASKVRKICDGSYEMTLCVTMISPSKEKTSKNKTRQALAAEILNVCEGKHE